MSQVASPSIQEQQFLAEFQQAIENKSFDRMVLSQYKGELAGLEKITCRVILLQEQAVLSCLYKYKTQDVTKNLTLDEAIAHIQNLLNDCKQANLFTATAELQLKKNKKKAMLNIQKKQAQDL